MTWLFVVIAVLVVAGAFLASLGLLGELPPAPQDLRPDEADGEVAFDRALRGYRMDEVDAELARLHGEVDRLTQERDAAVAHEIAHRTATPPAADAATS